MDDRGQRHICLIPDIAIEEAGRAGVPLAHACALLTAESSGGNNWYGEPKQPCGMPRYSEVTEANCREYFARRDECGTQGIGVLQLTWAATQDEAQRRGGAWDPRINLRVGLELFQGHLVKWADPAKAFSLYNTGRPDPSPYSEKAMRLVDGWEQVIQVAP